MLSSVITYRSVELFTVIDSAMTASKLKVADEQWLTGPEYLQPCNVAGERFLQVTALLLENPNLNSTHLFRADILYDSAHQLKTTSEKERQCQLQDGADIDKAVNSDKAEPPNEAPRIEGALLQRKILRKLIPRKPQLDRPLDQWCYIYNLVVREKSGYVVVYVPQVKSESDMPWYHPPIKSLAYLYEHTKNETSLSVHFLPFSESSDAVPSRLHRTFISLLQTFLRLAKNPTPDHGTNGEEGMVGEGASTDISLAPSALKDTIIPQHTVQDTYTHLKQQYAQDLILRWAEKTDPSKHVFEDLSIAAFLIELLKQIYPLPGSFPGFIDIACGNGVLTYILIKEGYQGRGFDARRRTTWEALEMDEHLDEAVCIPQPFLDHAPTNLSIGQVKESDMKIHNGVFMPGTFIISNHADELTAWTPMLAALSSPDSPLPFLAIPCCSHALSGAKHRYSPKDIATGTATTSINDAEDQPAAGDLKALRAAKTKAVNHQDDKSMYACLTRKVVALAQELGHETELTLMRIPSTRNIGIVGNRKRTHAAIKTACDPQASELEKQQQRSASMTFADSDNAEPPIVEKIGKLLERECAMSGGVAEAARTWIERAQKLQKGKGRGKVNLGGKPEAGSDHD